jgi:phosphate transport system substrate-binding protein
MKMYAALLGLLALQDPVGPDVLDYEALGTLNGALQLGPSGGFDRLLSGWAERMKQHYPDLRGGKVEANAPPMPQGVISGACPLGIMTRRLSRTEAEDFRFHWGYLPTEILVGADAVTILVHPDNPIRSLVLEDVDSIFSSTCKRGGKPIRTWGDAGLEGDWKSRPIHLYGPAKDSISRVSFQDGALRGGLLGNVKEVSGIDALLQAVTEDPQAIAFVGGVVGSDRCRPIPVRASAGSAAVEALPETILSLSYPLAVRLYIVVRRESRSSLDPISNEFLKLILSRDGQEVLAAEGLIPVTGRMARKELLKLN